MSGTPIEGWALVLNRLDDLRDDFAARLAQTDEAVRAIQNRLDDFEQAQESRRSLFEIGLRGIIETQLSAIGRVADMADRKIEKHLNTTDLKAQAARTASTEIVRARLTFAQAIIIVLITSAASIAIALIAQGLIK